MNLIQENRIDAILKELLLERKKKQQKGKKRARKVSKKKKKKSGKKKRDRCLRIADRKFDKPSAYKSSAAVRCRQGDIWKGVKEADDPQAGKAAPYGSGYSKLRETIKEFIRQDESLNKWFKEKWVRINTQGDITGDCGTMKNKKVPSRCLPKKKAQSMTKAKRKASARKKKREGRKGKQFVKNPK